MKMNQKILLVGAVLFGCMCSNAMASWGIWIDAVHITPSFQAVPNVNQFDITPEINALRAAKTERDNAIKNSHSDAKTIYDAMQKYENIEKQHLENIKNRRRDEYMKGFEVSRSGYTWCSYRGEQFRIDCPNPSEWVLIPGSGRLNVEKKNYKLGHFDKFIIEGPKETNNDVIVYIDENWNGEYMLNAYFTLYARYRYNDAMIARFLETDMARFRERIEAALN